MAKEQTRLNLNMDSTLHQAFKVAAMAQKKDMTTVVIELIEEYVRKHYPKGLPPELKKKARRQ